MGNSSKPSALLSLIGVILLWPHVLTKSVSSALQNVDSGSLSAGIRPNKSWHGEELPRVSKRSTQRCDNAYEGYCLNNGECMLLVDISEHHCKCERGFYGPRCANIEFVTQPMGETQIIVAVFCVCLLIIGLAGALYFFCKWYKKNRFLTQQKQQGYRGIPLV